MVIERPDLRESNRALFHKVQQVWDAIENGTFEPKIKAVSFSALETGQLENRADDIGKADGWQGVLEETGEGAPSPVRG